MGDESVWKTQQFPLTFYDEGEADTCVFWDLNDYPIPSGVHPASIRRRILHAIRDQGIVGDVSIHAYVDASEREYCDAGFQVEVFPKSEASRKRRVPARTDPTFLTSIFDPVQRIP
ncbi:unnamed protein product [Microthlaspi erraticum]|uniref:NYN domain-containing protein n=1 Tax=Microthlaspi erraticum TaxID=1685480 RepID=A0A6D2IV46_9BRAS|nr:unnamed protein product [Microthlaspi erraticum]